MTHLLFKALWETIAMVGISTILSVAFGVPLAVFLVISGKGGIYPRKRLHQIASFLVNALRSIPYIILTVLMMPLTKACVGSTIGTMAAIVPLTLAGILLVARVTEDSLRTVSQGLLEVGLACGASMGQIIRNIMVSEALPSIVSGITTVIINLIGFSAMAGAVGGGGLGDLAIRYGYQRYDVPLMLTIVLMLIIFVQLIQTLGGKISQSLLKGCSL